jgi:hypothetical protein
MAIASSDRELSERKLKHAEAALVEYIDRTVDARVQAALVAAGVEAPPEEPDYENE